MTMKGPRVRTKVWIVPHTHYDAEVFITEDETLEIGCANLLGALALLREEPTFRFVLDQTCYIEPFLHRYPEEREFMQRMIDAGRLEIVGGMYIMPDVNIPSGESFIRQIAWGRHYCETQLGVDVRTGWTIDSFGHHPQIPQLMAKCGFDQNAFQRLMPKDGPSEFYFEGLDGTRLFCHWMPHTYCVFFGAPHSFHEFKQFADRRIQALKHHAPTPNIMAPAGADLTPVEGHIVPLIEEYNRSQDDYELVLATPREFFEAVKTAGHFPTVKRDLNPVFLGCYSARIDVKQWNRRLETDLTNCEKLNAIARLLGSPSREQTILDGWKGVLFNQFHDIICGSHVDKVFERVMDRFKQSSTIAGQCLDELTSEIGDQIDTSGDGVPIVVFNTLGWERSDCIECSVAYSAMDVFEIEVRNGAGEVMPSDVLHAERYGNGAIKLAKLLFIATNVPALGYAAYRVVPSAGRRPATDLACSEQHGFGRQDFNAGTIENEFYRLTFDLWSGVITSIIDKQLNWELLPENDKRANFVVQEQDFGNFWQYNGPCKGDAVNPLPARHPLPGRASPQADFSDNYHGDAWIRDGKAMVEFGIEHPFGSGKFATRVRLYSRIQRIDIRTTLVNNDERVRYRAAIPTAMRHGTITHEIPFGAIEREEGEYPAQNWIDCSDGSRGVTLLNRGLPGNNVVDGVMMLSLLKCTGLKEGYGESGGFKFSTATDGGYEKGKTHIFDYALVPHEGDWKHAGSYRKGMEFNVPLIPVKPRKNCGERRVPTLPPAMSFISVSPANVVFSAATASGDGILVRLYEAEGRKTEGATLQTAWKLDKAYETDPLGRNAREISLQPEGRPLPFDIGPFEIKTFKLLVAPAHHWCGGNELPA